ncbi:hypothetical protein NESM_000165400 [Novymonas esmeraldas]|uniref:Uncharacterized protein n=1 Tax=Novymonas esmeraldas TaxID=1808958 RepID=A0AAW0F4U7_9TRYP
MSLYSDVVSDQLPAAISAVRSQLVNLNPLQVARTVFPELLAFFRKYWAWAMYFVILRKLYRILSRTSKRTPRAKRTKRSSASIPDSNESVADSDTTSRAADVTFLTETTAGSVPAKNQVIVGDGVIVVNRNDRYVEVYERKNVSKVDDADAQVEALLREFAARNRR